MDEQEVEQLVRKLRKRGFITDAVRELCSSCSVPAVHIYKLVSRLGGREIQWCMACGQIRSYKRSAEDKLVEDVGFDLPKFLE